MIYQSQTFRGLPCSRIQVDEIWSFVYAREKNVITAKAAPEGAGDVWMWTALYADTKLLFSWLVGGRDAEYAAAFIPTSATSSLSARRSPQTAITPTCSPSITRSASRSVTRRSSRRMARRQTVPVATARLSARA